MPPLILSAAQNTTIGMKTRWNGTTDVGVNTPGYISVSYGLNINQLTGNFVNYNGVNYPFDYSGDGSFSISDLTALGRLYNGFNDTVPLPAYSLAIKSFYGTKPVGIGFHVGTIGDINSLAIATVDSTRPIYSSNVNSMIVGYSTGGPKLFISERDIKSEKQNVFRFVGGSTFFGANDVIFGDDGLPTGVSSPQSGVIRSGDAGYNINTAGASLYLRGGKGTGTGAGGDIVFNTSPVNNSGTITFTGTVDAGLSTISGIPSTSALSVGMFIRQTTSTVGTSIGKLSYALNTSYGLASITAINSSSQITISPAATVAGANTFYASIENDPVERMRINSSGNVGIGTSSPAIKLEINQGISAATSSLRTTPQLLLKGFGGSSTYHSGIAFSMNEHTSGYWGSGILSHDDTGSYGSALTFYTSTGLASASPTEKMRIASDGKVGIGTTSPGSLLEVYSTSTTTPYVAARLYSEAAASGESFTWAKIEKGNGYGGAIGGYISQGIGSGLVLGTLNGSATITERLRINADGNIGIGGIAGTFYKLEVSGRAAFGHSTSSCEVLVTSSANNAYLIVNGFTGYASYVIFRKGGADKWYLFNEPTMDRMYLADQNSNDGVYISQNTTAWVANSDLRLKNVQGTITNALDKVQQLTGVKFKWKREADNPDAKVRVGLIAQDVQAVLPEAVDDDSPDLITDEETGKVSGGLGVRYTELVPLLVNAIKELTARVVALESQISSGAA